MAKVTGPLFSMTASGTVGGTTTFDKRGFVRQRVIPSNPKTAAQGNQRQILLAVQKALKTIGAMAKAAVKAVAPTSYRWNSFLLQQTIGPSGSSFDAAKTAYLALTSDQRSDWNNGAIGKGINEQSLGYASNDPISAGLALFAVCTALYHLGLHTSAGAPDGTNSDSWGDYFGS